MSAAARQGRVDDLAKMRERNVGALILLLLAMWAWFKPIGMDWLGSNERKPLEPFAPALAGSARYAPVEPTCEYRTTGIAVGEGGITREWSRASCAYRLSAGDYAVAEFARSTWATSLTSLVRVHAPTHQDATALAANVPSERNALRLWTPSGTFLCEPDELTIVPAGEVVFVSASSHLHFALDVVALSRDLSAKRSSWRFEDVHERAIERIAWMRSGEFALMQSIGAQKTGGRVVVLDASSRSVWPGGELAWLWKARVVARPVHASLALLSLAASVISMLALFVRARRLAHLRRELEAHHHQLFALDDSGTIVFGQERVEVALPRGVRTLAAPGVRSSARAVLVDAAAIERDGAGYREASRPKAEASLVFEGDADLAPALMALAQSRTFRAAVFALFLGMILARIILFDLP